jgi:hypothetical protein
MTERRLKKFLHRFWDRLTYAGQQQVGEMSILSGGSGETVVLNVRFRASDFFVAFDF